MIQTLQRLIGVVVAIGVVLSFCVFTVSENEVAIRTQFREIVADRKSTRLNSSHEFVYRLPSSA